MSKEEMLARVENTDALFYGELEYHLDQYLPKFFSVEVKDVGFNDKHPMNTLEFWFVVSWLVRMDFLEYGTSPKGAWLTESGKEFKEYVLSNKEPITSLIYGTDNRGEVR
jgi:hypothetical protein